MMSMEINICFLFMSLWTCGLASMTCQDQNGNSVDWYVGYKTHMEHNSTDWRFKEGMALFYLDVNTPTWTVPKYAVNQTGQPIYNTLQQIYDYSGDDLIYMMYNDEKPKSVVASSKGGHTKGVVAFDQSTGFWLVHSKPKFPPKKEDGYAWRHDTEEYGQSFLCITFKYDQLQYIKTQLMYNQPNYYDQSVSWSVIKDIPHLSDLIEGRKGPGPPYYSIATLTSAGGQNFTSFAKSSKFGRDLYDALVAPTLKQDLLVETWLRSAGTPLNSSCSTEYKVLKIEDIVLPGGDHFCETADHAKWAITFSSEQSKSLSFLSEKIWRSRNADKWTCIGDINRMESQFRRGGGTVCLQNSDVWTAFRNAVQDYETCKTK